MRCDAIRYDTMLCVNDEARRGEAGDEAPLSGISDGWDKVRVSFKYYGRLGIVPTSWTDSRTLTP